MSKVAFELVTCEEQVIDAGIGANLKRIMHQLTDSWLVSAEALNCWCQPVKKGGLGKPSQRVLMALWASAAWELMLETTDVLGMFFKTGSAMTLAGARDDDGKLFDDRIKLEGVDDDDMKKMRPLLVEEPAKMTYVLHSVSILLQVQDWAVRGHFS